MNHNLTDPQTRLLLKLLEKPAPIHKDYRPLKALVEQDLVRAKHVGQFGTSATYELSPTGAVVAKQIREADAAAGRECTCARQWSLKHEQHCPAGVRASKSPE